MEKNWCARCGDGNAESCLIHPGQKHEPGKLRGHHYTWSCCGEEIAKIGCTKTPKHVSYEEWRQENAVPCKRCNQTYYMDCRFHPERSSHVPHVEKKPPNVSSCVIFPTLNPYMTTHKPDCCGKADAGCVTLKTHEIPYEYIDKVK